MQKLVKRGQLYRSFRVIREFRQPRRTQGTVPAYLPGGLVIYGQNIQGVAQSQTSARETAVVSTEGSTPYRCAI